MLLAGVAALSSLRATAVLQRPSVAAAAAAAGAARVVRSVSTSGASDASSAGDVRSSLPFEVGQLNHVAIAVPDLKKAAALYRDVLGARVSDPVDLPEHGVTTIFVHLPNTKFELLHPFGENSPIANFLQKNASGGVHHVCFEVDDIHVAVERMKASGIRVLNEKPKIGAHGKPVVFLHPKSCDGVLVELEQA